jgi:hypothetical protein
MQVYPWNVERLWLACSFMLQEHKSKEVCVYWNIWMYLVGVSARLLFVPTEDFHGFTHFALGNSIIVP